jgi:hypothetical protein
MAIGRFTWFGMTLVGLGWVVLVADMLISEAALRPGNLVAVVSLRSDVVTVAQTGIVSGFALAIYGALREGFGALNRFFEAVLQRSTAPRPAPAPVHHMEAEPAEAVPVGTPGPAAGSEHGLHGGRIKDRNYVILANGSVEVETLLGTRIFATLDEARDFIR